MVRATATRPGRVGEVTSDRGDASSNVVTRSAVMTSAGRPTAEMLHPGVPHTLQNIQPWGGEHGESCKDMKSHTRTSNCPEWKEF
ncbi:hypothetical protein Taro_031349 [Colocasia esculenta]|uniref:Uncharacterized protein n=1 Tax=Colocasia esculenta TaxID=4460 RepID=A0A843VNP7_COLES|nr:hypothetical protein [Colocasia esculenta]